jgi:RNA polymerase sigma-70 factor (ECF subfamily)
VTEDAQLIQKTLDGQSAAFGELVRKYQDRLYNTMVHVTGCRDDAQDVVQDAFVQAFVKLDSFQQASAFYTWLYRIAFNVAISHRRRKKPTTSVEETRRSSGDEPSDDDAGPSERLEQEERRRLVQDAIARLSEEHRTILVLREIDGCCYETIAEILELPIGTVRSRLHRARLQLREELKEVLILEDY